MSKKFLTKRYFKFRAWINWRKWTNQKNIILKVEFLTNELKAMELAVEVGLE